jgi:hypothetical protein
MYQVPNPDEDTFMLRGWNHNPTTKTKVWYFTRDEERYGYELLHCKLKWNKLNALQPGKKILQPNGTARA